MTIYCDSQCAVALAVSLFCTFYPEHAGGFILPMKIAFTCYFFVCGIVFSLLVRIVSVMLNIMTKRVGDRGFTHVQIARLQRCYLFVGNLVNAISSAFGFALLVILAFVFIWTVNGSFMAYVELNEPGPKSRIYSEMAMLITTLISYTFTVYAPDKIKQEVRVIILLSRINAVTRFDHVRRPSLPISSAVFIRIASR